MLTVAKLVRVPEKNSKVISFEVHHPRSAGKMYPKFFINKFTKIESELKENGYYLLDISLTYAKNLDNGTDEKRASLFLRNVKDNGFDIKQDETYLGLSVVKGLIVNNIKKFSLKAENKSMPWLKSDFTFYRIKCLLGKKNHTYLWFYGSELYIAKGDKINAAVRLFNKRAYTETGEIDYDDKHCWEDKKGERQSNWYTELELTDYSIVE